MHSCVGEKWGLLDAPQFVTAVAVGRSEANSGARCIVGPSNVMSGSFRLVGFEHSECMVGWASLIAACGMIQRSLASANRRESQIIAS